MLKNLKSYLKYGNHFCGIEHCTIEGEEALYSVVLKRNKNELVLNVTFKESDIESLVTKLPKKQHVSLIINSDKVATKLIQGQFKDGLTALNNAFPNIDIDAFLYEVIIQKNSCVVSICRKEDVDNLIRQYSSQGISIIDIGLGVSKVMDLTQWLPRDEITLSNTQLILENNQIVDIEKAKPPIDFAYNVNGVNIQSPFILALSGALSSVLQSRVIETNYSKRINELQEVFKQKRFFSQYLKIGLATIFGILLVNFIVFNHYFNKVNALSEVAQFNQSTNDKVKALSEEVAKSQKLYEDVLKISNSKSSFFLNSIAQSLPSTILLKQVNYQPLVKRIKTDQPIELNLNTIEINGLSSDSEGFSEWVQELEGNEWISKLEIMDYSDVSKKESLFKLKAMLND